MSTAARARSVAFGVVLLGDAAFPPDFVYALGRIGIPTLDLTRLRPTLLPRVFHPDAAGHRAIAAALAASPLQSLAYARTADLDARLEPR